MPGPVGGGYGSLVESHDFQAGPVGRADAFEPGPVSAVDDHLLGDRLDALETERVIRRALELEAASLERPHLFDVAQVERIAIEIGIDIAFVHQAVSEVRLRPADRNRLDRWILPKPITELVTITGVDRAVLDASIERWMTVQEGLAPGGLLDHGREWDIDRRWRSRLRARRASGANRVSRIAGGDIAHRVQSLGEGNHVIAMQAEGTGPLYFAKSVMIIGAALVFFGTLGSALDASPLEFVGTFAAFMAMGTAIAALGVLGARRWARGISRAFRRSLAGLAGLAVQSRSKTRWYRRR